MYMKQVILKGAITTFVVFLWGIFCLSCSTFGKTIHTSANSKNVWKNYVDRDYTYVIKAKKTGIMKMRISLKTTYNYDT